MPATTWLNAALAVPAFAVALWLRPWRLLVQGPPWPWLLLWLVMPLSWAADRHAHVAVLQPMSGAVLAVLLAGWPLAVLALAPVALAAALLGDLGAADALHRLVWLGVAPATLGLAIGGAVRRWLPHHLFVYILGRGFFGTLLACALSGWLALALRAPPPGSTVGDLAVALWLTAFGEAFITGMLTAILVAFRPQWLASYADRLYLPSPRH